MLSKLNFSNLQCHMILQKSEIEISEIYLFAAQETFPSIINVELLFVNGDRIVLNSSVQYIQLKSYG